MLRFTLICFLSCVETISKNTNNATLPLQPCDTVNFYRSHSSPQCCRGRLSLALHNVNSFALVKYKREGRRAESARQCWKAWLTELQCFFWILSQWLKTYDSVLCRKRQDCGSNTQQVPSSIVSNGHCNVTVDSSAATECSRGKRGHSSHLPTSSTTCHSCITISKTYLQTKLDFL